MDDIAALDRSRGSWFKGNLHCHSTESDGSLPPGEIVAMYRKKGYSFLAFSEHEVFGNHEEFNGEDFIIMPAIERSLGINDPGRPPGSCYHLHGVWAGGADLANAATHVSVHGAPAPVPHTVLQGTSAPPYGTSAPPQGTSIPPHGTRIPVPAWRGPKTAQSIIDEIIAAGYMAMFNHPVWSRNDFADLTGVCRYSALEIYNHGCEEENHTGNAIAYWDHLLREGRRIWGIATDDNHNRNTYKETPVWWDSFGGFVMVNAPVLTREAIAGALLTGQFYSSTGPEVYRYGVRRQGVDPSGVGGSHGDRSGACPGACPEPREVYVECSPVEKVYFLTYPGRGYSRRSPDGSPTTHATYKLSGNERYVRVECVDASGKTAWTNPIFFDERAAGV